MSTAPSVPFAELRSRIGQELGVSRWIEVDQNRINRYAAAVDDLNDVHVDEDVGRKGPFGTTIAHGLLTLGLVTTMAAEVVPAPTEMIRGYYYGFNRVRFVRPVLRGSFLRGRFRLIDYVERTPGEWLRTVGVVIEVKDQDAPALVTEYCSVHFMAAASTAS